MRNSRYNADHFDPGFQILDPAHYELPLCDDRGTNPPTEPEGSRGDGRGCRLQKRVCSPVRPGLGAEGWPCPNLSPTPRYRRGPARPSRLPAPRSQLGKSSKSPDPGPRAARTSGPFCARLPTAGPQPAGARTIPGLVAGGGAARVAKVTRARGGGSGSARAGRVARAVAAP